MQGERFYYSALQIANPSKQTRKPAKIESLDQQEENGGYLPLHHSHFPSPPFTVG
jgi:hypothetical protein